MGQAVKLEEGFKILEVHQLGQTSFEKENNEMKDI